MNSKKFDDYPSYVQDSVTIFHQIITSTQNNSIDFLSQTGKGELFVLLYLYKENAGVLASDLSTALNSSAPRISAVLKSLERKGHIVRTVDEQCKRSKRIDITNEGKARIEAELDQMQAVLANVFSEMGEQDTETFINLARKFSLVAQKYMKECHHVTD